MSELSDEGAEGDHGEDQGGQRHQDRRPQGPTANNPHFVQVPLSVVAVGRLGILR